MNTAQTTSSTVIGRAYESAPKEVQQRFKKALPGNVDQVFRKLYGRDKPAELTNPGRVLLNAILILGVKPEDLINQ
ncbi:hypothetical protein [Siphonobacter aquaeclarae]|uniref:Uncharacterized protein n=1 Tax=Siphonobacter aquaeclarae TaxID=563176 RepID=A0A1G9T8E5_9BACT|nr:hypothetical protein [Siphonobacter aquaeclarae]SDM43951.1 hypothetical protein SAMN04488090_3456 [Siphonobacter aquaeclarae]